MKIVTSYKTNSSGTGQIVARLNGRQKTTNLDPARSSDANHGVAAANVILNIELGVNMSRECVRSIDNGLATHESNDSGTKHTFYL